MKSFFQKFLNAVSATAVGYVQANPTAKVSGYIMLLAIFAGAFNQQIGGTAHPAVAAQLPSPAATPSVV